MAAQDQTSATRSGFSMSQVEHVKGIFGSDHSSFTDSSSQHTHSHTGATMTVGGTSTNSVAQKSNNNSGTIKIGGTVSSNNLIGQGNIDVGGADSNRTEQTTNQNSGQILIEGGVSANNLAGQGNISVVDDGGASYDSARERRKCGGSDVVLPTADEEQARLDNLAKYWMDRMRIISQKDPRMAKLAEKLIPEVFLHADEGALTINSHVYGLKYAE